jgi:hypothetical protein
MQLSLLSFYSRTLSSMFATLLVVILNYFSSNVLRLLACFKLLSIIYTVMELEFNHHWLYFFAKFFRLLFIFRALKSAFVLCTWKWLWEFIYLQSTLKHSKSHFAYKTGSQLDFLVVAYSCWTSWSKTSLVKDAG